MAWGCQLLKFKFSWEPGSVGGWISPVIAVAFTIVWCLLIYSLIGDRPTDWNYGAEPDVPGKSFQSTEILKTGPVPNQVEYPSVTRSQRSGM